MGQRELANEVVYPSYYKHISNQLYMLMYRGGLSQHSSLRCGGTNCLVAAQAGYIELLFTEEK